MPMTPRIAAARALKKRKEAREFAAVAAIIVCVLLAFNVAAYYYLFGDDWSPSSRIAILLAGFLGAAVLFASMFKRVGGSGDA